MSNDLSPVPAGSGKHPVVMIAIAVDSLVFLLASDWIGVAFHALVLYFLWRGIAATRKRQKVAPRRGKAADLRSAG